MRLVRASARVVPGLVALGVVAVGIAGFVAYFTADVRVLLTAQGPLSLQPSVAEDLELFFDGTFLRNGQIAVHFIGVLVFWSIGILILIRGGRSPMRVTTALTLLLVGAALFSPLSLLRGGWSTGAAIVGTLRPGPVLWRSAAGLALLFFTLVFPNGRPLGRPWTIALGLFVAHIAAWTVFPGTVVDPREWVVGASIAWTIVPPLGGVAALVVRFYESDADQRPRIRLVVVAFAATVGTALAFWTLQPRLEQGLFDLVLATRRLGALHDLNLLLLLTVSLLLLPVAVGVSVVRYRLWDLGMLINRALVYGVLTAMVAGAFLVGMVGIGSLLAGTIGGGRGIAGVITGVLLVLVFQPVRRRVQASVDRRFYREKYDADRAFDEFSLSIGDLVDTTAIDEALQAVVTRTVQPESFSVVILPGEAPVPVDPEPVDRDHRTAGADALKDLWPDDATLLVPLVTQGVAVGAMFLGPRRSGRPYEALDRRMLEKIAMAVGPAVRVGQLVVEQQEQAADRARIDSEMAVARTIQRDLLPHSLPVVQGWDFAATYVSSREVGGDYYDAIALDDGGIGLLVADVSGKGVPAAMVMATCRAVIRSIAVGLSDPAEVLTTVNQRLVGDISEGMFVTCFYGVLDPASGVLRYANAGHTLPVHGHPDGTATELRAVGMPFGWFPDADYHTERVQLEPGSVVVIASDGVIEARDQAGTFFGVNGLKRLVAAAHGVAVVDVVLEALRDHCAPSTDLGDDVTMLGVHRKVV